MTGANAALTAHTPVLLDEVLDMLQPRNGQVFVDATFGAGGYSRAILNAAPCTVFAIDRDPEAIAEGQTMAQAHGGRLTLIEGHFADMDRLLAARGIGRVAGVVFDLGVSSMQIDRPERGFSFRFDAPLDMRMGRHGQSAAVFVNAAPEEDLARIIRTYGEERRARAVARAIVTARSARPIERTGELADIVRRVVRSAHDGIDPATRTFQALRIHLNDELDELARALRAAERILAAEGRLVVVAYHSLEDRIVKNFLAERSGRHASPSRHRPQAAIKMPQPTFILPKRRALRPGPREIARNPRARSARLRTGIRSTAPAWSAEAA